jgi:hypothetical protein
MLIVAHVRVVLQHMVSSFLECSSTLLMLCAGHVYQSLLLLHVHDTSNVLQLTSMYMFGPLCTTVVT